MEKQEIWNTIVLKVDKTCDELRMLIDPGIKETVIAFQALGFETTRSCEGHDDRALPYPWIDVYCGEYSDLMRYNDGVRMGEYLEEFYCNYQPLKWARLSLDHFKDTFRVQTFIGRTAKRLKEVNSDEYKILRENCSREMHAFTVFLKEKFWNQ